MELSTIFGPDFIARSSLGRICADARQDRKKEWPTIFILSTLIIGHLNNRGLRFT
jgi:hypothetical protein